MGIEREDYFCDNCHSEFIIDLNLHDDITEADVKHCPFCGHKYDSDILDLNKAEFGDYPTDD
tara:strand:+ start:1354 stop:1539 length:186 start_codon:yes stop_codon:yes gene_type:complete